MVSGGSRSVRSNVGSRRDSYLGHKEGRLRVMKRAFPDEALIEDNPILIAGVSESELRVLFLGSASDH